MKVKFIDPTNLVSLMAAVSKLKENTKKLQGAIDFTRRGAAGRSVRLENYAEDLQKAIDHLSTLQRKVVLFQKEAPADNETDTLDADIDKLLEQF